MRWICARIHIVFFVFQLTCKEDEAHADAQVHKQRQPGSDPRYCWGNQNFSWHVKLQGVCDVDPKRVQQLDNLIHPREAHTKTDSEN